MNTLITGGAGFMGSHLARRLLKLEHTVTLLTKPSTDLSRLEDILPQLRRIDADMNDMDSLKRCMESVKPGGIFHLAASNIQSGKTASSADVVSTNVLGTASLLDAAKDLPYEFFIQTGSFLEYGMKKIPMKETDLCEPAELYSISKLAATLLAQATGRSSEKPILNFRIFTPYGPSMQKGRLVEQVIGRALRNEEILLTEPAITRDFVYVSDLVDLFIEGMDKAKTHPGAIFNAGSGLATTLETLLQEVIGYTRSKSIVRWHAFPAVLYDTALCQADTQHTFSHFSWRPAHTLVAGVHETIDWYRSHLNS